MSTLSKIMRHIRQRQPQKQYTTETNLQTTYIFELSDPQNKTVNFIIQGNKRQTDNNICRA
jgi:hypothetical protein